MTGISIDDPALFLIKKKINEEKASAMRIFIGGGGCCKRFEIIPVSKELAGDVTFLHKGVKIVVEKEIAENASGINIRYDEHKGLLLDLT